MQCFTLPIAFIRVSCFVVSLQTFALFLSFFISRFFLYSPFFKIIFLPPPWVAFIPLPPSSSRAGSSQHLKSKFGHGFQIDMTLTDANKVDGTRAFLRDNFAEAKEIEVCTVCLCVCVSLSLSLSLSLCLCVCVCVSHRDEFQA